LVSQDNKAAAIYVPIANKDESYRIAEQIRDDSKDTTRQRLTLRLTYRALQKQLTLSLFSFIHPQMMVLIYARFRVTGSMITGHQPSARMCLWVSRIPASSANLKTPVICTGE
jgi:hypothetical protein